MAELSLFHKDMQSINKSYLLDVLHSLKWQLTKITWLQNGCQVLGWGAGVPSKDSKQVGSNELHRDLRRSEEPIDCEYLEQSSNHNSN